MMKHKLFNLYGLRWDSFSTSVPIEALYRLLAIEQFCWRVENTTLRERWMAHVVSAQAQYGQRQYR